MAGFTFSEANGVGDSIFKDYQAAIQGFILKQAEAFEAKSALNLIFKNVKTTGFAKKYTGLVGDEGLYPVGENGNHPHGSMREGFSKIVEHDIWKGQMTISREMIDDDNTGAMEDEAVRMMTGYGRTKEMYGAAMLGGAIKQAKSIKFRGWDFDTATADDMPLFAKAHKSVLGKSTQSNLFADAFSNDALMAAECAMQDFRDDAGNLLTVAPTTIIIPNDYQLKKDVFAAIGADKDPNTANNGFNYNFGRWNVIVWQYLNQFIDKGSKPWMLFDKDYSDTYNGLVWQTRIDAEIKSYVDNETDANVWNMYARFRAAFNDWRCIAVGGISGGDTLISA